MRKRIPDFDFAAYLFMLMAALYFLGHYLLWITG
jgi:hypothetical protein